MRGYVGVSLGILVHTLTLAEVYKSADLRETPCFVYELTEGSVRSINLVQEVSYDGLFLWGHLRKMYRDTRVLCFYL